MKYYNALLIHANIHLPVENEVLAVHRQCLIRIFSTDLLALWDALATMGHSVEYVEYVE